MVGVVGVVGTAVDGEGGGTEARNHETFRALPLNIFPLL